MKSGKIEKSGTYSALVTEGIDLGSSLEAPEDQEKKEEKEKSATESENPESHKKISEAKLMKDEEIQVGRVKLKVWRDFLLAGGSIPFILFTLFIFILSQGIQIGYSLSHSHQH